MKRLVVSGGRGISFARIMKRYSNILKEIFPIWLATPNNLMSYEIKETFEYLFFDEASQIPMHEFLPVLYQNGKERMVICGDAKQLPPSVFFQNRVKEMSECLFLPNALEESMAVGFPRISLGVHYRSSKQNIAVSNEWFYENSLETFAAPEGMTDIQLVKVNGVYDRGNQRTNSIEAQKAIDMVREYIGSVSKVSSIGILTMNVQQQKLIMMLLKKDMELQKQLDIRKIEIKVLSLEMAQGSEFDLVIFSLGYGKDKDGIMPYQFGPLSHFGGEKRLNVAFSHARKKMAVISSLSKEDLQQLREEKEGVRMLKQILMKYII